MSGYLLGGQAGFFRLGGVAKFQQLADTVSLTYSQLRHIKGIPTFSDRAICKVMQTVCGTCPKPNAMVDVVL